MYQVRVKKFETRRWKVVAEFATRREAMRYACRLEYANRRTENEYDNVEVKYPDGTRITVA